MVIETKAPQAKLDDERHVKQLSDYCQMLGTEVGVLTNGIVWHFYCSSGPHKTQELAETFDLIEMNLGHCETNFQRLLSRDKVSDRGAHSHVRQAWVDRTMRREWENLLMTGDPGLVRVFRKALRETTDSDITNAELRQAEDFIKKQAQHLSSTKVVPHTTSVVETSKPSRNDFGSLQKKTDKPVIRPTHVEIFGHLQAVKSWRTGAVAFVTVIYERYPAFFNNPSEINKNFGGFFFVDSPVEPEKMRMPARVGTSNLWFETHASASALKRKCQKLLQALGLPPDTLRFFREGELLDIDE